MHDATCLVCAQPYQARAKTSRYCSPTCARVYEKKLTDKTCTEPDCNKRLCARGLCSMHWKRKYAAPRKMIEVNCDGCGQPTMKDADPRFKRRYCSYECRDAHRAEIGRAWAKPRTGRVWSTEIELHPNPQRPARLRPVVKQRKPRVFTAGICQSCDAPFVGFNVAQTCSPECARIKNRADSNEHKYRRRARKRAAFVAPVYRRKIFERDKWRCQICRVKVKPTAVVPNPLAPTIDHIIPLSEGGTHEPANVRLACFLCNAQRGDRGGGEQLALIG